MTGKLGKKLKELRLLESFIRKLKKLVQHYLKQIGILTLEDILLINITVFLHRFGVGDYSIMVVDFELADIIGTKVNIYWLAVRRLICENNAIVSNYNLEVLELLKHIIF